MVDIKKLIIFLVVMYVANKILGFFLKRSEKIKQASKRKITMPALNSLSLYSYEDFKKVAQEYLINIGFDILDEENELMIAKKNNEEYLIFCKQVKEYTDKVNKEDFYIFVSELNLNRIQQGVILTNGQIEENIKMKIGTDIKGIELEYIEGNDLVKKLRRLKEEKLYKGEV